MKTNIGTWLSVLAVAAMTVPLNAADGTTDTSATPAVHDVALKTHGILTGKLVDENGQPVRFATVHILHGQREVAAVRTDLHGSYTVKGLRSGLHVVRTKDGEAACRFWTEKTAPPACPRQLVLAADGPVVRGNNCGEGNCNSRISTGHLIGATLFFGTSAAMWASVAGDNPVQQPQQPPASP